MLSFPRSINKRKWKEYLGRQLTKKEHILMDSVEGENRLNMNLERLENNSREHNLYIPQTTNVNGNCMFESLNYHNIGSCVDNLRQGLSYIMYQYRDYEYFFPEQKESLRALFNEFYNNKKHVYCEEQQKLYKYNYEIMCRDLATNRSWTLLPAELIWRVISLLFKIKIVIINDTNSWVNTIDECKAEKVIYIGHIFESHFLPLQKIDETENNNKVRYRRNTKRFIKWAKQIEALKVRLYNEHLKKVKNE